MAMRQGASRSRAALSVSASKDAFQAKTAAVGDVVGSAMSNWDDIGFGVTKTSKMFVATCDLNGEWTQGELTDWKNLELDPSSQVLNYGQSIFEGMKASHSAKDRVVLFRPTENAARLEEGALRMSMPPVPRDLFVKAVKSVVAANFPWVPPHGKGSLYLRPLLMGTGPILGLGPAPSYTFLIYTSPVGSYFKGGQLVPIDLLVETRFHRAAPGGMGGTKAAGNYSPVLVTQLAAKKEGFADVLYLDAVENKYIEEVSSCNMFVVKGKNIATPPLGGTILPGITRKSVIQIARDAGYTVEERPVSVDELCEADEVFCTGTAVVVSPVGSVTYKGTKYQFGEPGVVGPIGQQMYTKLTDLQFERSDDPYGWVVEVEGTEHL